MKLNREVVYPRVNVYRNAVANHEELLQTLKRSEESLGDETLFSEWKDWYGFGIMMNLPMQNYGEKIQTESKDLNLLSQKKFIDEISEIFYEATKDYLEEWPIELKNWHQSGLSVCKYDVSSPGTDLAMTYHTDYTESTRHAPGLKFGITCTIYLNDDYEGGDISFLHLETSDVIDYKPKAGDVIVFPSGEPYYHGVKGVYGSPKYFIRTFWQWEDEGSPEWHEGLKKYGSEKWSEMEKERQVKEIRSGIYHRYIVDDEEDYIPIERATPFFKKGYKKI